MSLDEPKTRHLSREELSRVLSNLHEPAREPVVREPPTTIWQRPDPSIAARSREPATQLEVQRHSKVVSESPESKVDTDRLPSRFAPSRAIVTRVGIGMLVAGCAWWVGLRPKPPTNVSAEAPAVTALPTSAHPTTPTRPAQAAAIVAEPSKPSLAAQPPSPRAAADLLIAGREREALDAYRALALNQPKDRSFVALVQQLERELTVCDQGSKPCAR